MRVIRQLRHRERRQRDIEVDVASHIDNGFQSASNGLPLYAAPGADILLFSGRYLASGHSSNLGFPNCWNSLHAYFIVSSTRQQNSTISGVTSFLLSSNSISTLQTYFRQLPKVLFRSQNALSQSNTPEESSGVFSGAAITNHFNTESDLKSASSLSNTDQPTPTTIAAIPVPTTSISPNGEGNRPPIELYKLPLVFSSDKSNCSLVMKGASLKLYNEDYFFSSDDECDQRNRRIDAELLEAEREEVYSVEYQKMREQTLQLDGIFPEDHVSPYYTVMHFREVHNTEGELVSNISLLMKENECFQSAITKYDVISQFLEFKENVWIQDVRKAISNRTITSDLLNEYHLFITTATEMKLKLREQFYKASHSSDSETYCDGCDLPRGVKYVKTVLNYTNGLLIRKFVGNEEVQYTDKRMHPLVSL